MSQVKAPLDNRVYEPNGPPYKNEFNTSKDLIFVSYPSFIGSKAITLPFEVQESLLCQTSDAREVVRQLQETLQPHQASLKEPEPETKQLIRCLARTAKNSNRLDVFKHLRETTPAGTTGPLMPEHLDVQNIPGSKRRDLTVDLCGGEEWKLVAEALGLTPQEIRFLDNRTLNPLDAALAFIAKQRHITVGDLYDLLSECGFPVIADLRL
ncbi:uncharacterized protein LOC110040884 [Orbicella faveolata]|uniref:uncharacterized protein LOC110040884 n=1 Tax=Orbicella faveolata TaxID=48498 RepID=UPI0009E5E5EE|nr:uncharacterized protein LOC110040884 [Orbicella faveolata]